MTNLSLLDASIVLVFLVVTAGLGLTLARRARQSLDHYYLGGRRLPWYLLGIAGMTNWFDLTGTMIITAFLYLLGPRGLFVEFRGGAVLLLAFALLWTGKWHRRSGCMTSAEWYSFRFGAGGAARFLRVTSAVLGIVYTVGLTAYLVRGTTLFAGFFYPEAPVAATAVLVGIATLFMLFSGFYGVVITDVVQGLIIIVACAAVATYAYFAVPDAAALAAVAQQVTGNTAWLAVLPSAGVSLPAGYDAYTNLLWISAFYLLKSCIDGLGAGDEARYFGARSDKECAQQSLLQGLTIAFRWPLMMGFAILGLLLVQQKLPDPTQAQAAAAEVRFHAPKLQPADWHAYTAHIANGTDDVLARRLEALLGPEWARTLPLIGFNGSVNPEQILPAVLSNSIPSGLRGLILAAMLAAMMSTLSSTVNSVGSAMLVRDIYQNLLRPQASTRELLAASYAATTALVAAGFWLGLAAPSINDLWGWLMMSLGAGALAPKVLRFYWWRCNATGCATGFLVGAVSAIAQRLWLPGLPEWQSFLLVGSLAFGAVVAGSLASAPAPAGAVRRFYRQTRPFGWWGPYARELDPVERLAWRREHRADLAALPFVLAAQITLFLAPMLLLAHLHAAAAVTAALFAASAIAAYFLWWRPSFGRASASPG